MVQKDRRPHKLTINLSYCRTFILSWILLLASLLVLVFVVCPYIIQEQIKAEAQLVPGGDTWRKYANPPYPLFIKFYIFNATIPKMVKNQALFHVKETGPYVWEEKRTRRIFEVNDDDDTLRFIESVKFYFRPDLSKGNENDVVNIVNIPLLTFAYIIYKKTYGFIASSILTHLMEVEKEGLIQPGVKVRDLIFDGVKINALYESLATLSDVSLPSEFTDGKFALYNNKNGTDTPEFKVNRGIKDHSKFGDIVGYNQRSELPYWKGEYCNKVQGSDGGLFPPFVTKDRVIYIFVHEICRTIFLEFVKEVVYEGIPAYHFKIPRRMLDNPVDTPVNECYNTRYENGIHHYDEYRGAYRLFTCKGDIPLLMSNPHLHTATKRLLEGVVGLKPNESIHETELIIEPQSGAMLYAAKRIMVSMEHMTLPDITGYEDVYHAAVPITWVEESIQMDDDNIASLKRRLIIPSQIVSYAKWVVVGASIVSAIIGVIMLARDLKKLQEPQSLLSAETEKIYL